MSAVHYPVELWPLVDLSGGERYRYRLNVELVARSTPRSAIPTQYRRPAKEGVDHLVSEVPLEAGRYLFGAGSAECDASANLVPAVAFELRDAAAGR